MKQQNNLSKIKQAIMVTAIAILGFIATTQVTSAYFDKCTELEDGSYLYTIHDDSGTVIYSERQHPDGTISGETGKKPEGYVIGPGGEVIDVWQTAYDLMDLRNGRFLSDALAELIPVTDLGDTIITKQSTCSPYSTDMLVHRHYLDFSNTFSFDPTNLIANVQINSNGQSISVISDKAVNIKLINYLTSNILNTISTNSDVTNTISTANLQIGCNYGIIVEQEIDGRIVSIKIHNFCKE